ncbi:L-2-amino-thiazoline-4-carboxylic acid hydrolase [Nocardia amamiensis]|uniref:L-2-amino-thiazoline-4-carboxylic acid hydrolase n=1 Tax=Nocardia amamiensis TaxID=404578 RepID=UPI000835EE3A|nr:L-2-amino-thiazoline-4-carboxylic acid hydrolase [Nocardia amamiensis]
MHTDHYNLGGDYVPDPSGDATAIIDAFFDHVAATVREHDLDTGLVAEMHSRLEESVAANRHRIIDEPAAHNLRMTLALVVAYRMLSPHLGRTATIAALRRAFVEPLGASVRAGTRAMLDAAPDPFAAMVAVSKARERYAFGDGFTFVRPADDNRAYHVDVTRCFYHEVLVAHSAPELTPVMCEFDANWIEAIDPAKHGFSFERPTTIGRGGSHCPFHFDRTP